MIPLLLMLMLLTDPVYMFCPYGCGCDEQNSVVTCIRADLEVMPISLNPSLRTLILKYNKFTTVDASLNFYTALELVDLSNNGIVSLPSQGFKFQRSLHELRLNENKINQLAWDTFHGLRKLRVLELRRNAIEQIPDNLFIETTSLEVLDLGGNQITEIQPRAFVGLKNLRVLKLDDNRLTDISEAISELPNLRELHVNKNKLTVIPDNSLILPSLHVMDLSGNLIEKIHEKSFESLMNLKKLNLRQNNLYGIPTTALSYLGATLETLEIGANPISILPTASLPRLPRLTTLDISHCPALSRIDAGAISALPDLTKLIIASNKKLISIASDAFDGAPNIEHVDISNNALEHIPPSLLDWSRLRSLQIAGNPLVCDCTNYFLKAVIVALVNSSAETIRVVRCGSPVDLRDKDLALVDLQCDDIDAVITSSSYKVAENSVYTVVIVATTVSIILIISTVFLFVVLRRVHHRKRGAHMPVKDVDILHYEDTEPRYVTDYHRTTANSTNIVTNPYHENVILHPYFTTTLLGSSKGHHQHHQLPVFTDGRFVMTAPRNNNSSSGSSQIVSLDHNLIYSDPSLVSECESFVKLSPDTHYEVPFIKT